MVETDYGYHLIKVTKRHPGTPSDFKKIKEVVREVCAEDERQKILAEERKTNDSLTKLAESEVNQHAQAA